MYDFAYRDYDIFAPSPSRDSEQPTTSPGDFQGYFSDVSDSYSDITGKPPADDKDYSTEFESAVNQDAANDERDASDAAENTYINVADLDSFCC